MNVTVTTANGTSATSASDEYTYNPAPTVTGVSPTNGPPGGTNTVTVTGTGFTGLTAVDFGTQRGHLGRRGRWRRLAHGHRRRRGPAP